MANAIATQGFKLEIQTSVGPPAVYQAIGEITNFQAFDGQAAEIDVTHLLSTAKEFRMGLQDFGTMSIDVNYLSNDLGQKALRTAKGAQTLLTLRMTHSNGATAVFTAYVLSAPISGGVDSKVDGSFAFRISGNVTFTDAV